MSEAPPNEPTPADEQPPIEEQDSVEEQDLALGKPPAPSLLKRWSPLLIVVGVVIAAVQLIPHVPRSRDVALRLSDPASVTAVSLSWSAIDDAERNQGEPLEGTTWRFDPGQAPALLKAPAHLADGRYALELTLERAGERALSRRLITVGNEAAITVPVP